MLFTSYKTYVWTHAISAWLVKKKKDKSDSPIFEKGKKSRSVEMFKGIKHTYEITISPADIFDLAYKPA